VRPCALEDWTGRNLLCAVSDRQQTPCFGQFFRRGAHLLANSIGACLVDLDSGKLDGRAYRVAESNSVLIKGTYVPLKS
jgi:hypothetical protein